MPRQETLRFVGGGAKSKILCQILADVTGHKIQVPVDPQNAGAAGAALICALGLGTIASVGEAKSLIRIRSTYTPDPAASTVYDGMFPVFKQLYAKNKRLFWRLNAPN